MKLRTLILSLLLSCPVMLVAQGLDTIKIDEAMGRSGQKTGEVYRLGFPRTDLMSRLTASRSSPTGARLLGGVRWKRQRRHSHGRPSFSWRTN